MQKMSSESAALVQRLTLHGPTMGTRWSASLDADDGLDIHALQHDLAAVVNQVDQQMSPWKPDSDLMRVNRAPVGVWVELPAEMLEVLACALGLLTRVLGGWSMPGVLVRHAMHPMRTPFASHANPSRLLRMRAWSWTATQAKFASWRPCSSICAALPRATRWIAWFMCCKNTAFGMHWQRWTVSCAPWAVSPAA
jgi:thiamine biosynthesis lipoprotein